MIEFRSAILKKVPEWSPTYKKYYNLYKQPKKTPDDEQCKKWIQDADKEHDAFVKRLKLHDKHMFERVDKFAKANPIIPDQNFDEVREDIKNHKLADRKSFYLNADYSKANVVETIKISIIKSENSALRLKMKAILKDIQIYQKYDKKVREITLMMPKGPAILKQAEDVLNKMGPEKALMFIKSQVNKI